MSGRLRNLWRVLGWRRVWRHVEANTLVENDSVKLGERLINHFTHHCVWGKGNFLVPSYYYALTSVHINTLARTDTHDLECAKSLYFHLVIVLKRFTYDVEGRIHEGCCLSCIESALLQHLGQLHYGHFTHSHLQSSPYPSTHY